MRLAEQIVLVTGGGRGLGSSIVDAFSAQLSGSVRGALNTVQAALPGMRARGFGRIVNIGTNLFQNPVVPCHDHTAAKAALLSLTRTPAKDLGRDGVTVNMVSGACCAPPTPARPPPRRSSP